MSTRWQSPPAPGVKVSRITALADDIALNLAATSVRIEAISGTKLLVSRLPQTEEQTVNN